MNRSDHSKPGNLPSPEDDALWQLLGQFPAKKASGSFVQSTLRAVRLEEDRRGKERGFHGWYLWLPAVTGALAIAMVVAWQRPWMPPTESSISLHTEEVDLLREELHLMTYVDELLTVSDPTTLDDDGLAELF